LIGCRRSSSLKTWMEIFLVHQPSLNTNKALNGDVFQWQEEQLILTRTTSIGVLASAPAKPAVNDARKCVPMVSEWSNRQINCFFIQSYTANSTPLTMAARCAVGKTLYHQRNQCRHAFEIEYRSLTLQRPLTPSFFAMETIAGKRRFPCTLGWFACIRI
jgi:hypothetical protein